MIILAGGTGSLGGLVAEALAADGTPFHALVRSSSDPSDVERLRRTATRVVTVDFGNVTSLARACGDGSCVVSTLAGLEEVMVGVQTRLLEAAVEASVPRFIPSDYCIDYTRLEAGHNRNLDHRRAFAERIDEAPIAATGILNGMFTGLLNGPAPVVVDRFHRVVHWGDADQVMDFTTREDTAAFTARAAADPDTPRYLRIAGDQRSARGICEDATAVREGDYRLFRAGGLGRFRLMIRAARLLAPGKDDLYPPWQGMQYLHDMFSGLPTFVTLDNDRYADLQWTSVREVLAKGAAEED